MQGGDIGTLLDPSEMMAGLEDMDSQIAGQGDKIKDVINKG